MVKHGGGSIMLWSWSESEFVSLWNHLQMSGLKISWGGNCEVNILQKTWRSAAIRYWLQGFTSTWAVSLFKSCLSVRFGLFWNERHISDHFLLITIKLPTCSPPQAHRLRSTIVNNYTWTQNRDFQTDPDTSLQSKRLYICSSSWTPIVTDPHDGALPDLLPPQTETVWSEPPAPKFSFIPVSSQTKTPERWNVLAPGGLYAHDVRFNQAVCRRRPASVCGNRPTPKISKYKYKHENI